MNWDSFPHRPAAGSCSSDGGVRAIQVQPARYLSPWMRLLSVIYRPGLLLSHRTKEEEEMGETLGLRPLLDKMGGEAEEAGPLAWARGLLGWVYPGPQAAPSLDRPQRHSCRDHPSPPSDNSPEPDYGYSSLEEEQAGSKQRLPELGPGGIDPKEISTEKEEAGLLLRLPADSTMTQSDRSSGDDGRSNSSSSGDDEMEGDSPTMESWHPLPRPQCSNRTIAYILGSNPSSEDEDSDSEESDSEETDSEDSDWDDDGFDSDGSSELSDAGEAAKLWHSLAAGSSDPYNLLNFQACLKTQRKPEPRTAPEPTCPQRDGWRCPVLEEDEDRLDSGFSDTLQDELQKTFTQLASERQPRKKVAFDEHVTEYYVSSEEIRKGPWEEYARDRCRFQKRIRETEGNIGYCFTLEHRWTVLERMRLGS